MTKHVPDLEMCKKLKEKGFPQETKFYWKLWAGDNPDFKEPLLSNAVNDGADYRIAAPLATELLAELKKKSLYHGSENPCNALADFYLSLEEK